MGYKSHFASELQRVREDSGLSRREFAEATNGNYRPETIKAFETGHRTPTVALAAHADRILRTKGMFASLQLLAEDDTTPFGELRDNEQRASAIRIWDMRVVPGLLQTADYAHALLNDPAEVAERMMRQGIFERDDPPHVHVIIPEGVLYLEIGGLHVLKQQLEHLTKNDAPWTLQVMPDMAGAHNGLDGPLTLLEFPGDESPIAFLDSRSGGTVADDQLQVSEYWRQWERLASDAMPPSMSRDMIIGVVRDLSEE